MEKINKGERVVYTDGNLYIKKISSGQFVIHVNDKVEGFSFDIDNAIRTACDLKFKEWSQTYENS